MISDDAFLQQLKSAEWLAHFHLLCAERGSQL
jgi:hypothetical protein